MKSTWKLLFVTLLFFQIPTISQGQLLRRALDRLGEKVIEKKVEKEVNEKIDEVADSIVQAMDDEEPMTEEEKKEAAENRRKAGQLLSGMLGGVNQVDLPSSYDFNYRISMEMEDDKGEIMHMTTFLNEESSVVGYKMEEQKSNPSSNPFIIMDFEKEYMATFSEDEGSKVAMSMPLPMNLITSMASEEMEEQQKDEDYSIEKTGNTRTINGYSCTEYVITDEDYIQHVWLTKEVDVDGGFFKIFSSMMKEKQKIENPMVGKGYPILIEMVEKKNDKKSYIRTKEIKEGSFPFQASEYSYASTDK